MLKKLVGDMSMERELNNGDDGALPVSSVIRCGSVPEDDVVEVSEVKSCRRLNDKNLASLVYDRQAESVDLVSQGIHVGKCMVS